MELPVAKFYGIRCMFCDADFWMQSPGKARILCARSFEDLQFSPNSNREFFIRMPLGIIIGFGKFQHTCKAKT